MADAPRERLLARAVEHFGTVGVADRSLRGIAEDLGTSHRMLIHHFGSREGLLAAVSLAVEERQRAAMAAAYSPDRATSDDPVEVALAYWDATVEATRRYGPLFFEIAAHAAQGREHAADFGARLVADWLPDVTALCREIGIPADVAEDHARLALAATRGLLLDLLVTDDEDGVRRSSRLLHEQLLAAGRAPAAP